MQNKAKMFVTFLASAIALYLIVFGGCEISGVLSSTGICGEQPFLSPPTEELSKAVLTFSIFWMLLTLIALAIFLYVIWRIN